MAISKRATLYFDRIARTEKLQTINALAKATYYSKEIKQDIIKNLGVFLDKLRQSGKGTYGNDIDKIEKQFMSQYTPGLEFGIWNHTTNGNFKLTKLALDMATDKIHPEYYISNVLLNYYQIINNKVINPLYSTLKYMDNHSMKVIHKEDINKIPDFNLDKSDRDNRNMWFNILGDTLFFKKEDIDTLRFEDGKFDISKIINLCNKELLGKSAKDIYEKYSNQYNFAEFITKESMYMNEKFRCKVESNNEENLNNVEEQVNYMYNGVNKIICGAPGTGKSNKVNKEYYEKNPNTSKRIIFHPEYTYNDFIGYIRPVVGDNDNLTYEFTPGPFTEIICGALLNEEKVYNLIIDEINRANAAAVFGDIFQLLDRDSNTSKSEYSVHNRDIYEYIKKKFDEESKELHLNDGEVYIPNNLNIIATMNTADQNVFIMDTAFKRRWEFEYMDIDFEKCDFRNLKIQSIDIEWERFVRTINKFMMSVECSDLMIPEDKQIGPFFIKHKELNDSKKFAYKVLMYLWDDVFKMERERIFNSEIRTFSQVVSVFSSQNAIDVFNEDIKNILKDNDYVKEYMQVNSYEEVVETETPEEGDVHEDR